MINTTWVKAALVRAVKTMAQTAVALIGTGAIGVLDVDWVAVLSASALAGILSILTSIAGIPEVKMQENGMTEMFNEDLLKDMLGYDEDLHELGEKESEA